MDGCCECVCLLVLGYMDQGGGVVQIIPGTVGQRRGGDPEEIRLYVVESPGCGCPEFLDPRCFCPLPLPDGPPVIGFQA